MTSKKQNILETLESRRMMDGSVTAMIRGGDLIVRGDEQDNHVVITRLDSGKIRIAGAEGTTVNGKASVDLAKFSDDLTVLMQTGGEDHVAVQGPFLVPDDLSAQLGAGELVIEGSNGPVKIDGDLIVRTGADGHVTIRNEVRIKGETSINVGGDVSIVSGHANVPDYSAAKFDRSLTINNPYLPYVVGTIYTYEADVVDDDTGEISSEEKAVEVLNQTKTILGVQVRVVRDRVYAEGVLIEDTYDWFAQDNNGNVWYFGEEVINYEYDDEGNFIGTNDGGTWEAGVNGAQAGIVMEAKPRVGFRYYQEFSAGEVLDQAVVLSLNETTTVPAGTFKNVLRTQDTTAMEPFNLEHKLFAPGIGGIGEFDLDPEDGEILQTGRLVSVTLNGNPVTQLVPTKGFKGTNATYGKTVGPVRFDDEVEIDSKGPALMSGVIVKDELEIHSDLEILVMDSTLNAYCSLFSEDTVSLREINSKRTVNVGGAETDVVILDSSIRSFEARFGRPANSLIVGGSTFNEFDADGGAGNNTFENQGGNVFGKLKLKRFVKT